MDGRLFLIPPNHKNSSASRMQSAARLHVEVFVQLRKQINNKFGLLCQTSGTVSLEMIFQ